MTHSIKCSDSKENLLTHVINRSEQGSPVVEFHEDSEKISQLKERMQAAYREHGYVLLSNVRMWKGIKSDSPTKENEQAEWNASIKKWEARQAKMQRETPAHIATFAAINKPADTVGTRESILAGGDAFVVPLDITPRVKVDDGLGNVQYDNFWTPGLNGPLAVIATLAEELGISAEKVIIRNESFEAEMTDDDLACMNRCLKNDVLPTTVRVTPPNVLLDDRNQQAGISKDVILQKKERIITAMIGVVEAVASGRECQLHSDVLELVSVINRNTFGFVRLSDAVSQGGFHPVSNSIKGMEDSRFHAVRLLKIYNQEGEGALRTELEGMLEEDRIIEYRDTRLEDVRHQERTEEKVQGLQKKTGDEVNALLGHFSSAGHAHSVANEPEGVPKDERDFIL